MGAPLEAFVSRVRLVVLLVLIFATVASATGVQLPGPNDSLASRAAAAYDAKDWEQAAKLYAELSKQSEPPPRVWLRLGAALRELRQYDEAISAFEKANAAGAGVFGEYGEAAVYAAMQQRDQALDHLERAGSGGNEQRPESRHVAR